MLDAADEVTTVYELAPPPAWVLEVGHGDGLRGEVWLDILARRPTLAA